ncbi:MAG: malto-oligosyltrehalose synthase, partial [Rhodobacterales bacterium]|nr:malto-oligosyltrehalose synthase [Rhodobacterales bacterium]
LTDLYRSVTGRNEPPAEVVRDGKLAVLRGPMRAELEAVVTRMAALAAQVPEWADLGRGAIREGLAQTIASLDIYRPYADADGISADGRARMMAALDQMRQRAPDLDPAVGDLLAGVLTLDLAGRHPGLRAEALEVTFRFQQLSGPVMAKGLEDRALYRFNRLIALNEVGSHPGSFTLSVEAFHQRQRARRETAPQNMLATSSHDTKRGEDARMRIVTISSHTGLWQQKLEEWLDLLRDATAPVDPNEVYFFLQLLVGVWPGADADLQGLEERIAEAMVKSIREAGVNSRWVFGNEAYETAVRNLVTHAVQSRAFMASFADFLNRIDADATHASLIQTALKLTVPGVPDIYQGAEMWDRSLVDPDSRRPVDFDRSSAMLPGFVGTPVFTKTRSGAEVKLALIRSLPHLRAAQPRLFAEGDYEPLHAEGPAADGFLGFMRRIGTERLMFAAALHPGSHDASAWSATRVVLPEAEGPVWANLIDGGNVDVRDPAALFQHLPLAILQPQ